MIGCPICGLQHAPMCRSCKKLQKNYDDLIENYGYLRSAAQMCMNLSSDTRDEDILASIARTWDDRDACLELLREAEKSCTNPVATKIRKLLEELAPVVKMMDLAKDKKDRPQ